MMFLTFEVAHILAIKAKMIKVHFWLVVIVQDTYLLLLKKLRDLKWIAVHSLF